MSSSSSPPLAKYLASSDKKTRDKAVQHLASFLSDPENDALPEIEIVKLWKGLFYCFWMSDKPRVQQDLAQDLAQLLLTITSVPASQSFLRGFWITTVREWNGIDRLRMDKYYVLVRRFTNASFRLLIRAKWDPSALREHTSILADTGGPLWYVLVFRALFLESIELFPRSPTDARAPAGLAFHLTETYLEELEKAMFASESPEPVPILALLSPFISLAAHTPTSATYKHLEESLFMPLLAALQPRTSSPPKRARVAGPEYPTILSNACVDTPHSVPQSTLRQAVLKKLFSVASAEDTRDANRRKMYALYKTALDDDDSVG